MRIPWLIFACLGVLVLGQPAQADEPVPLKVLYAGNPAKVLEIVKREAFEAPIRSFF